MYKALPILIFSIGLILFMWIQSERGKEFNKPTHHHVTCADDIFNGEVIKKGKKYYLDSGQEIWIPLKECVLVEL